MARLHTSAPVLRFAVVVVMILAEVMLQMLSKIISGNYLLLGTASQQVQRERQREKESVCECVTMP